MNHVGQPPLYLGFIEGSSFCYDATWTLAKALNPLCLVSVYCITT